MTDILFLADGTWNGPGPGNPDATDNPDAATEGTTNVYKMFVNLLGEDDPTGLRDRNEQERALAGTTGRPLQIAKYLHGVGDSANPLVKALGGGFGTGIVARILRGYTFISRNYRPGDRIFITGFSRGAYTARALGGMIGTMGLLDAAAMGLDGTPDSKQQAYEAAAAVWNAWRRRRSAGESWLARLEERLLYFPGFFGVAPAAPRIDDVPIEAIGVWDTVGALGIPDYINDAKGRADIFKFADTILGSHVRNGFHAMARDEQRVDFSPTPWEPDQRILQMLFPGAHADVGGSYPTQNNESGLSDGGLRWMIDNFAGLGLRFKAPANPPIHPDPLGCAHMPWLNTAYIQAPRAFPGGMPQHASVSARQAGGPAKPDPSLPPRPYL